MSVVIISKSIKEDEDVDDEDEDEELEASSVVRAVQPRVMANIATKGSRTRFILAGCGGVEAASRLKLATPWHS